MAEFSRRAALALAAAAPAALLAACTPPAPARVAAVATPTPTASDPTIAGTPTSFRVGAMPQGPLVGAEFGPTGGHWPTRTPRPSEAFDIVVESECTWHDISNAIRIAMERAPQGKACVLVKPGTLTGNGAGSSNAPVLQGIGTPGRPYRVLVAPRDGTGSVTQSGSIRINAVAGVSFVGFWLFPESLVLTSVQDFAWAWSKGQAFNITTGKTAGTSQVELVECVTPEGRLSDNDVWAVRTGGTAWADIRMTGCYLAPSYKSADSSSHCDTLQLSGSQGGNGLVITDSVLFASTNAGFIPSDRTGGVLFDHSLVVGGDRMLVRYPLPAGANEFRSGKPAAVNGIGTVDALSGRNSIFAGNVRGHWLSVDNCIVPIPRPPAASNGGFTIDRSLITLDAAWLDRRSPMPTDEALRAAWAL